jgi:tetratricopeptide (TPR) repeat protein
MTINPRALTCFFALLLAAGAPISRAADPVGGATVSAPAAKSDPAADRVKAGAEAYARGDYPRAIAEAQAALKINPRLYQAYNLLGFCHLKQRQFDQATADFDQAIAIAPNDAAGYSGRGSVSTEKGDFPKAIADFNRSIELAPSSAATYVNRSNCYYYQGQWDPALADLNQADSLSPNSASILTNRGNVYSKLGKFDQAISDYNRAMILDPLMKEAYLCLGYVFQEQGDYDRAIALDNVLLSTFPGYSPALAARGLAEFKKGQYQIALSDLDQAIAINPKLDLAFGWRAWIRATAPDDNFRDAAKALSDAKTAGDLNSWKEADYFDILAAAEAEAGKFESAVADETKAIGLCRVDRDKKRYQERLLMYQGKQPFREKIGGG